uniref:ADAM metallopeptidase domain 32 n=1 Tax=Amazona collaria TaxID=241587 RepID=A0A8B9GHK0_9PSIT
MLILPFSALLQAKDAVSYVLSIEGRPYTIRLHPHCYYRGYIGGFPNSAVTLSTCSGLRGLLQFENISYGIEPLGYSPAFEHFVYRVRDGKAAGSLLSSSRPKAEPAGLPAMEASSRAQGLIIPVMNNALAAPMCSCVLFQYDHMGSNTKAATQKIIQVFNLVNSVFSPLNVTIVLTSMELWAQGNKVSTAGEAEDLLQQFLQWAKSHLALQPYDTASLLVYREQATFMGTAALGKACQRDAAGIAAYQEATTLESFSALLAQLLGRSLGIGYDESPQCHCPGHICIMSPKALHFSGVKAFSTCSIRDFEAFLRHGGGTCLFSRPRLTGPSSRRAAVCGNGIVEPGEQCDCGAAEACMKDKCCTAGCRFKPGVKCSSGLCCDDCQFKHKHWQCRPAADEQCDLAEFCTGASAPCPPDLYVQDGHGCEQGTGYCYKGRCQSPDLQCQQIYGKGSRNAPVACYEELNSQRDRFGHCGLQPRQAPAHGFCRNLRCGKLICTYPHRNPFPTDVAAVAYVYVRGQLCVSLDYLHTGARPDPVLVPPGTKCGSGKVCVNNTCHPHSVLGYDCDSKVKCHGHGVCNNKRQCHCYPGWKPPDCLQRGSRLGGSIDSSLQLSNGGQYHGEVMGTGLGSLLRAGRRALVPFCCPTRSVPGAGDGGCDHGMAGAGLLPPPAPPGRGHLPRDPVVGAGLVQTTAPELRWVRCPERMWHSAPRGGGGGGGARGGGGVLR